MFYRIELAGYLDLLLLFMGLRYFDWFTVAEPRFRDRLAVALTDPPKEHPIDDLFDWLKSVIQGREVIDSLQVDSQVWKITYSITRNVEGPEMDEDLRELLQEETYEQSTITTAVTAEILRIEGEDEGKNVIEFRRKSGSPQLYNDHVRWIVGHMQ